MSDFIGELYVPNLDVTYCILYNVYYTTILGSEKIGNLNIKTKLFDFEEHIVIGWLS